MAECKLLKGCIFFKETMVYQPDASELLKDHFCLRDYTKCARYMVYKALGRENVPPDLFPYEIDIAKKIILVNE